MRRRQRTSAGFPLAALRDIFLQFGELFHDRTDDGALLFVSGAGGRIAFRMPLDRWARRGRAGAGQLRIDRLTHALELREPQGGVPVRVATFRDCEGNGFELRQVPGSPSLSPE